MSNTNSGISVYDKMSVMQIESEFDKAFDHQQADRQQSDRNWSAYSGFDHGQWPTEAVAKLKEENRHIVQYNFIRGKIDSLAGSISRNHMDISFVPVEAEYSELTRVLKELFYADKELTDWKIEFLNAVIDGLVYNGVLELNVTEKYSALGNIALTRCQPGHVIIDPMWKTNRSKDIKTVWKVSYMTPEEIQTVYDMSTEELSRMIAYDQVNGPDYQDDEASESMVFKSLSDMYGTQLRVVETHYIVDVPTTKTIIMSDDVKVEIPDNIEEEERDEWLSQHGLTVSDIIEHRVVKQEHWVKTTCSQISRFEFLEDKKAYTQIGRLPFYPWSSGRINGKDSGLVDLLIDAQQTINKRESLADHMVATAAHGGKFIDPAIVNNDTAKVDEIVRNLNKPNAVIQTAPGALASGRRYTQLMEKNSYEGDLFADIQRMTSNIDILSKHTSALSGRNESDRETGILFARKQMQGEIALTTLTEGIRQWWNDIGEGYLELAKQLYSGIYREFKTDFTNETSTESITLNEPSYDEHGQKTINNDLSTLSRHKVLVSESPNGETMRLVDRMTNSELMQSIPRTSQVTLAQLTKNIVKTLDMSDEDKANMEYASNLELKAAESRMLAEIAQMNATAKQAEVQVEQMEQQIQMADQQMAMQQMAGQEGGGGQEGQPQQQQQPQPQQ